MKRSFLLIFAIVLSGSAAFAADNEAAEVGYCKYLREQAAAQRDLLRSPSALVGPTQPSAGTPPQLVFGVTASLANNFKAPLTSKVANTGCDLFVAASQAQIRIDYTAPKLERDALEHRLQLVQSGSDQLQEMIAAQAKLVEAKNVTRPGLYYLQAARARLDMRRTSALSGLIPFIPTMNEVPLRQLVSNKARAEAANQAALMKLDKQSGWDVSITAGGRRQISDFNSTSTVSEFGGFGEVSFTYNLGRHAANSHLDRSSEGYLAFRNGKFDDVSREATILKKQLEETVALLHPQLTALQVHDQDIEDALKSVDGLNTNAAMSFKNQLLADRIVLRVDIGDLEYRIQWIDSYLRDNF